MNSRQLTADELAWTVGQVSMIVGAAQEDARPLAEFLTTIGSPTELQSQMLDMLGESPLALEFASSLISKRFPPETSASALASAAAVTAVAAATPDESAEPQQKQRKSKKQQRREQQERKEAEEKKRKQANRKRIKCDCQASDHPLLTNCLMCGRIVCDREGPGPCMFCGNDVQSPDQQLQQHMRRLLHREEPKPVEPEAKAKAKVAKGGGNSYSAKLTGGVATAPPAGTLLWDEGEAKDKSSEHTDGQNPPPLPPRSRELSEEEYLQLAFEALGIDRSSATAEAQAEAEAWTRAMRRKERLLEYDRTAAQRSRLIDQAADVDVDAISKWMSPEEKAQAIAKIEAHKKAQEDREARLRSGTRVLRLNLGSGSVDLEKREDEEDDEETRRLDTYQKNTAATGSASSAKSSSNPHRSSFFGDVAEPKFLLDDPSDSDSAKKPSKGKGKGKGKADASAPAQLDALAARRQMLRIQVDDDDSFAY
ncbi:hypothetical protein GGI15_002354 [Coemansia interrupta]|uniref:TRIP4/RQT4 C2HC5-type zinc finger domain-containing protein n=1 Tax=Coemansia interrupta TaxID=1126814 RepID=A0A9W8HK41_9FUNG|nr:hypothetical protein GGI15_002354 [Coemansia interrupta]